MTAPKRLCFIDSNIWIYAATQSQDNSPDPQHNTARQMIAQVQPCLSVQVINVSRLRRYENPTNSLSGIRSSSGVPYNTGATFYSCIHDG